MLKTVLKEMDVKFAADAEEEPRVGKLADFHREDGGDEYDEYDDMPPEDEMIDEPRDEGETVTMDSVLLIRVLELVREDVKDDATLHRLVDVLLDLSAEGRTLTMDDYEALSHYEDEGDMGGEEDPEGDYEDREAVSVSSLLGYDDNEEPSRAPRTQMEGRSIKAGPKTQGQKRKVADATDQGVKVRAKRNTQGLPDTYDDKGPSRWKRKWSERSSGQTWKDTGGKGHKSKKTKTKQWEKK